jgi:hypothetical protein
MPRAGKPVADREALCDDAARIVTRLAASLSPASRRRRGYRGTLGNAARIGARYCGCSGKKPVATSDCRLQYVRRKNRAKRRSYPAEGVRHPEA